MGTHGQTGFQPAILGWVSEMIARRSPIPVLTVRKAMGRLRSILVAVHEDEAAGRELAFAAELALRLRVPLQVLYFSDASARGPEAEERIAAMIRALPPALRKTCRLRPKTARGNAEKEILTEAKRHDLLVIVARREMLFKELLLGSTTDRVLQLSPIPVLTLPPRSHRRL
jgi:nucleotide-binding universal stress UspA family protein